MPKLQATTELRYAGKTVRPGDQFDASEKDAKILKAIRKAIDAPVVPKTQKPPRVEKPAPVAPVVQAEPVAVEPMKADVIETKDVDSDGHGYGRQAYRRRDLRAED